MALDLFRIFKRNKKDSKNIAKERLKLVLVHDRSDMSPEFLEMVEADIINVIKKYAEIDEKELEVKLTRMRRESDNTPMSALVANIPILKIKDIKK